MLRSALNEATRAYFGTSTGQLNCRPYWTNAFKRRFKTYFWNCVIYFFGGFCCFSFFVFFFLFNYLSNSVIILHLVLFARLLLFRFCRYTLMNILALFFLQTAHCYIHAAALVAEYLKRQGNTHTITETKFLHDHFFLHIAGLSNLLFAILFARMR